MAHSPQVGVEGEVWAGLGTSGKIPERLLKRGMDNLAQAVYITKGYTKFLHMMYSRFPKSINVPDREHRVSQIVEPHRILEVTVGSSSTDNHSTIGIPDYQAAQVKVNDMLYVKNLYVVVDTTSSDPGGKTSGQYHGTFAGMGYGGQPTAVNYSRTWGRDAANPTRFYVDNEPMIVTGVGTSGSAAVGSTKITVRRCAKGPSATDFGGAIVPIGLVNTGVNANSNQGAILTGDFVIPGLPSFNEGTGAPDGFFKNVELDNNFTQEFKYAVEHTKESEITKTWLRKSPVELNRMLRLFQQNLHMERTILLGQKCKNMDAAGRGQYMMGGIAEFIKKDEDHIIKYTQPTISYTGLLDLFNRVFTLGGSEERDALIGIDLYTDIQKACYNAGILQVDEEAFEDFDIRIEFINASGGKVRLIPLYSLQEIGWNRRMLVLDNGMPSFIPVTHDGWDLIMDENIQDNGVMVKKDQWIGIKGLERKRAEYHAMIDFN